MLQGGLPFSAGARFRVRFGLCCSRAGCPARQSGLSTSATPASLAFTRHLCSAQLGLSSNGDQHRPRPSFRPDHSLVNVRTTPPGPSITVPKGRFELPRVSPLRPERSASADSATSARLPIRLLAGWSRPGDSNPRPALYERAALPTELGRHVPDARLLILSARYLISNPGSLSTSSHIVRFPAFFGSFSGQGLW